MKKSLREQFLDIKDINAHYYSEAFEEGWQHKFNDLLRDSSVRPINTGIKPLIIASCCRKVAQNTAKISHGGEQRGWKRRKSSENVFLNVYISLQSESNRVDEINLEETDFARGLRKFVSPPDIHLIKDLAHHLESDRK